MNNCYFATKVSFLNEMKLVADKCGVDWDMAVEGFIRDGRIGYSHMSVPGPDGKKGFGGACFTKDTAALINYSNNIDVDMTILKEVVSANNKIRSSYDELDLREKEQNVNYTFND